MTSAVAPQMVLEDIKKIKNSVQSYPKRSRIPVHAKSSKIPYLAQLSQHLWVLSYSFLPFIIHELWLFYAEYQPPGYLAVFVIYFTSFYCIAFHEVFVLHRLGRIYGYLDGDVHKRDKVADFGEVGAFLGLFETAGSRTAMTIFLSYDPNITPAAATRDWTWWLYLAFLVGLYPVILDFWFYWYHRALHEIPFLWKFHRTHHLTKHPNPSLTAYAGHVQQVIDMVGIPTLTYLTLLMVQLPLGFYEWWVCHQYIVYSEFWVHSGLRIYWSPPSPLSWIFKSFHIELVVEDHDLHHRHGWRKSNNYSKQSRFWDYVFGTCGERMESNQENIDYSYPVYMPLI